MVVSLKYTEYLLQCDASHLISISVKVFDSPKSIKTQSDVVLWVEVAACHLEPSLLSIIVPAAPEFEDTVTLAPLAKLVTELQSMAPCIGILPANNSANGNKDLFMLSDYMVSLRSFVAKL